MSETFPVAATVPDPLTPAPVPEMRPLEARAAFPPAARLALFAVVGLLALSLARHVSEEATLTSSTTFSATMTLAIPILLAALAGMWSERAGIVNIGIEGMMIFGTWFGAYAAYRWGPWWGLLLGIVGGAVAGLIHAIATVRFNVDHTISGVAINLLALGAMRYASAIAYDGRFSPSPAQRGPIGRFNVPVLAGGKIGGWQSPDVLAWLERRRWLFVSDVAGMLHGFLRDMSAATALAILLVVVSGFVLWRTRFGLRVRSSGEAPAAAETLGVRVIRVRYLALLISGAFAGLGGAYLSVVANSSYVQGQTGGRGFIGIATMIWGNWRPMGILMGSLIFGFSDAIKLLGTGSTVRALFLFGTFLAAAAAVWFAVRQRWIRAAISAVLGFAAWLVYDKVDKIPDRLTQATPYVVTLVVLAAAGSRLRPPAHSGLPYRSGEGH